MLNYNYTIPFIKARAGESHMQQWNKTVMSCPFTVTPFVRISLSSDTNGCKYSFKLDGFFGPNHTATTIGRMCGISIIMAKHTTD